MSFKWGVNPTTQGDFYLERPEAEAMLRKIAARVLDKKVMADYDHLSLEPQHIDNGKAAAWYRLELRDDGLWVIDCQWTPVALKALRDAEYRYWSPAFRTTGDEDHDVITEWVNLALTNLPATDNIAPLVAAHNRSRRHAMAAKPKHEFLHEHLKAHMEDHDLKHADLAKQCGIGEDRMKEFCQGKAYPNDDEAQKLSEGLNIPKGYFKSWADNWEGDEDPEDKKTASQSTEEDRKEARMLRALMGTQNLEEAADRMKKLIEKAEKSDQLSARVEQLESEGKKREVAIVLRDALEHGRAAPAEKDALVKLGLKDLDMLKEILAARQPRFDGPRALEPDATDPDVRTLGRSSFANSLEKDIEEVTRQMNEGQGAPGLKGKKLDAKEVTAAARKRGSVYTG